MSLLPVLTFPNDKLRLKSSLVGPEGFGKPLEDFVQKMFKTMYAEDGIGLAAPQVDVQKRIITIDTAPIREEDKAIVLINPEILSKEGSIEWEEGCLSVPDAKAKVKRAEKEEKTSKVKI